jgi:hypothetical protein
MSKAKGADAAAESAANFQRRSSPGRVANHKTMTKAAYTTTPTVSNPKVA